MKPVFWIPASCAFAIVLSSCRNNNYANNPAGGTGPFDSAGNYREDLADDPAKWGKRGGTTSSQDAKPDPLPEIVKNDQPPPDSNPLPPANTSKPAPVISKTEVTTQPKKPVEKSKPVVVKAKPKPKPKPVPVKVKPKSTRYVVKAGDSLSAIASRTGSSVSAIQRANGISGTLIRPGQSLTIPKK
jgi:LysM repeat protein